MGKYELRIKINNARTRIEELESEIESLYGRKDRFDSDRKMVIDKKLEITSLYEGKLAKAVSLEGIQGRASNTLRDKCIDMFKVENKTSVESYYDSIVGYINKNISIADDKIEECRTEIRQLEGNISYWEQEIRDIQEEEEEENAGQQQFKNIR